VDTWANGFRWGVAVGVPLGVVMSLALLVWVQS
jgi:hypothetical protein